MHLGADKMSIRCINWRDRGRDIETGIFIPKAVHGLKHIMSIYK